MVEMFGWGVLGRHLRLIACGGAMGEVPQAHHDPEMGPLRLMAVTNVQLHAAHQRRCNLRLRHAVRLGYVGWRGWIHEMRG